MSASVAVRVVIAVAALVIATLAALRSVSRAHRPMLRAAQAISVIVGLAVIGFAIVYLRASVADADAFSEPLDHTDALYFSVTTTTTVGFGDIAARSDLARIVVMAHMVANVVVIGVATRALIGAARQRTGTIGRT